MGFLPALFPPARSRRFSRDHRPPRTVGLHCVLYRLGLDPLTAASVAHCPRPLDHMASSRSGIPCRYQLDDLYLRDPHRPHDRCRTWLLHQPPIDRCSGHDRLARKDLTSSGSRISFGCDRCCGHYCRPWAPAVDLAGLTRIIWPVFPCEEAGRAQGPSP